MNHLQRPSSNSVEEEKTAANFHQVKVEREERQREIKREGERKLGKERAFIAS